MGTYPLGPHSSKDSKGGMEITICKCNLFNHEAPKSSRNSFKGVRAFLVKFELGNVGVFLWWEENRRTRRKTLGPRTKANNKLNPHMTYSKYGNRTRAILVGGKCAHHCAIPAPLIAKSKKVFFFCFFFVMLHYIEELLELHRGQGMDIYWRDSYTCPAEEEYREMVRRSMQ